MLRELKDFISDWPTPCEIIIVNDGSLDNTVDIIRASPFYSFLFAKGQMKIIDDKVNRGKGAALKSGVLLSDFEWVLTMDADVATHPRQLKDWAKLVNGNFDGHTVYIASRKHQNSHITDKNIRKLSGFIFNRLVRMVSPLKLNDTQCGFKLYPALVAKKVFAQLLTLGWAHDVELLCRCQAEGYKIVELPVEWTAIEGSKISVARDSIKMVLQLIRIRILLREGINK